MIRTLSAAVAVCFVGRLLWRVSRASLRRPSGVDGLLDAIDGSELTERARNEMRAWIAKGRIRPSQFVD